MTPILATEGSYQAFKLGGVEFGWLYFALACGVVSLLTAVALMRQVLAADQGTSVMKEIAAAIQEGAVAFLKRQFKAIVIIIIPWPYWWPSRPPGWSSPTGPWPCPGWPP